MQHAAFCQHCGSALAEAARFCPACGVGVAEPADRPVDDLARGLAALSAGDLDRAIELLQAAQGDGSGFAALAYGTALLRRRRYAEAQAPLERAVALLSGSGEPLAYLGMARLHMLDPIGGREALDRALEVAPHCFAVRLKRAEFFFRLGYVRECEAEINETLQLTAPDATSLAFAEHLAVLSKQKSRQAYTRQPGRWPRLSFPSVRHNGAVPRGASAPQPTST